MAVTLSDCEVLRESRGELRRGKKFLGIRQFAIPTDQVETLRSSFEPSHSNIWPGTADTWLSATTYAPGDLVQGDGTPDSYIYVCILASTNNQPPNTTYWTRRHYSAYIRRSRVERQFPGHPNCVKVTSYYEKPGKWRMLRDNPGKAILEVDIGSYSVKLQKEQDGTDIIEGPVEGAEYAAGTTYTVGNIVWYSADASVPRVTYICIQDNAHGAPQTPGTADSAYWRVYSGKWEVVSGSNATLAPRCVMRLIAAESSLSIATYMALIGKTNDAVLANMGSAAAGTLMFIGYKARKVLAEDDLWDVVYVFMYDAGGWDTGCSSRRFEKVVHDMKVHDEFGADTDGTSRVVSWFPEGAAEYRTVGGGQAAFSAFNAKLSW